MILFMLFHTIFARFGFLSATVSRRAAYSGFHMLSLYFDYL